MIFLSYNWNDCAIADQIDEWFSENNIKLRRDIRDIAYKQSIKEFMESIRDAEFVIMIISEDYLKSKNCMYEVLEFVKEQKFKDKIIPVIKSNELFDIKYRVEIKKFWTEKKAELKNILIENDPETSIPLIEEIKIISKIESELNDFLKIVCDLNNILLKNNQFIDTNFDTIIKYIGKDSLKQNDIIVNCVFKNEKYTSAKILKYLNDIFEKISILEMREFALSVRFYSYLTAVEIEKKIYIFIERENIDSLNIFDYKDAYYLVAKRKIDEYNSTLIMWWRHLGFGYTNNLKEAGFYSDNDIESEPSEFFYKDQLAIKAAYIDNLNVSVFFINSFNSRKLVEDRNVIIGDVKYKDKSYF